MPNGRVGAVLIPRDDVARFFNSVEGDPVVGKVNGVEVALADVKRLVKSYGEAAFFLEGQRVEPWETTPPDWTEGMALVIHLSDKKWLWVTGGPVFERLKQLWLDWLGRKVEEH